MDTDRKTYVIDNRSNLFDYTLSLCIISLIIAFTINRDFGTDIYNYLYLFNNSAQIQTQEALEPLYLFAVHILQLYGLPPSILIDFIGIFSAILLFLFATKFKNITISIFILSGWLLLQQIFGTIRMGIGLLFIIYPTLKYVLQGDIKWHIFFGPMFHWSLISFPLSIFFKLSLRKSIIISCVALTFVLIFGSIKSIFFDFVPDNIDKIYNYSEHQSLNSSGFPYLSVLIHFAILFILSRILDKKQFNRIGGPLTLLFISNLLFYDFDYIGGRVANILLPYKLIALLLIFNNHFSRKIYNVGKLIIPFYCIYTSIQYYLANVNYF